jgi:hypothetical protein
MNLDPHIKGWTQIEGVENRVLRRLLGLKRQKVNRRMEFRNLYSA